MNQRNRSLLAITLACLLFAPALVSISSLHYRIFQVRKEVKSQMIRELSDDHFVVLTFNLSDLEELEWEDDTEFEFHGKMYDVIDADTSENNITYKCWPDSEETALNQLLKVSINDVLAGNSSHQDHKKQFNTQQETKYLSNQNYSINIGFRIQQTTPFPVLTTRFQSLEISPETPPPDA